MRINNLKLVIWGIIITATALSCEYFGTSSGVGEPSPTPDLTQTAYFKPPENTPTEIMIATATLTEEPPQIPTETPTEAFAVESSATATLEPTKTTHPPTSTKVVSTPAATVTSGSSVPGSVRPGESVVGVFQSVPPTIDGDFSEWDAITYTSDKVVWGGGYYIGEDDLSATFQVGWDNTHLYVGARIKDSMFVQNSSGSQLYRGDSVEIVLDTLVSRDFNNPYLNHDDYQLGISPGSSLASSVPVVYMWYPDSKMGLLYVVDVVVVGTDDGYQLEASMPWTLFGVSPAVGQHFGFAFSVSDNDDVTRNVQQTMVSNVDTRFWSNPTTWGDLYLLHP
jgi:hypothetical protein